MKLIGACLSISRSNPLSGCWGRLNYPKCSERRDFCWEEPQQSHNCLCFNSPCETQQGTGSRLGDLTGPGRLMPTSWLDPGMRARAVARPPGLEPGTVGLEVRCSIH